MITSNLIIERPIYGTDFKFIDEDTKVIAEYLYNELNTTFQNSLLKNIVKTYRTFNDIFIPIADFPVLKVYKINEVDDINLAPYTSVDFTISYILAYTQKQKVADISSFVSNEIKRLLKNADLINLFQIDWTKGITTAYDTLIDPDNLVYKYTNINCTILTCSDSVV